MFLESGKTLLSLQLYDTGLKFCAVIQNSLYCLGALLMSNVINIETPIGVLYAKGQEAVTHLGWAKQVAASPNKLLREAQRQIQAFFLGELILFDLPLAPKGTPFQRRVWQHLGSIPYGNTISYGAVGATLSTSPRAVGGACGANPIPLIIPCHRVVGQNGYLTGYSGGRGLKTKEALLILEQKYTKEPPSSPIK